MKIVLNLNGIVGQALRLPSFGRNTTGARTEPAERVPPVSVSVGRGGPPRRFAIACLASLTLFTLACSTPVPRVVEVSSRTRLQDVDAADRELFIYDEASRIQYIPKDLSIEQQREEFYVHWVPASIGLVKFEYRQVDKPDVIFEKTYTPQGDTSKLFQVSGDEFRTGGSVSAWRVSLWNGDQLVAEKKSFLW